MTFDITQIVVALIGLLSLVLTSVVVPLIQSKISNEHWQLILNYAVAGVQAAETLIGAGNGEKKFEEAKRFIEKQCREHGIKVDSDTIETAIQNAWKALGLDVHRAQ